MLALGFASGLPFLLTQNTLGYWLRDEGTSLKVIGFISWVGLAYVLKPLWSPYANSHRRHWCIPRLFWLRLAAKRALQKHYEFGVWR